MVTTFRARVRRQDRGDVLANFDGDTLSEAFAQAWEHIKSNLAGPMPVPMTVDIRTGNEDFLHYGEQIYEVCRTWEKCKTTEEECEECGFPEAKVSVTQLFATDSLLLTRPSMIEQLFSQHPPTISSQQPTRSVECICCEMLWDKGVHPRQNEANPW
jgi:hypothetical protein